MKKVILPFLALLLCSFQSVDAQYYYNRAFSFSGVAGDYVATDPGANLSITGSFTVECWIKPTNALSPAFQILVQKRLGSSATGYTMYLSNGNVAIRTNSTTRLTGTTPVQSNVWSHVAATYNSTTNVFVVYVNGVSTGTITTAGAAPAADTDSLRMANGFNSPYAGLIDEVRIWNVERTQAQIQAAMRLPLGESSTIAGYDGLVSSWRANSISAGSGTEEINGYTAHLNGPATYANLSNTLQSHLAFNTGLLCTGAATGTCVSIPNSSLLNPTTGITLECWLYTGNTAIQVIIGKGSSGYPYRLLKTLSNNTFAVIINGVFIGSGTYGGIIPVNKWTHLCFTYNPGTSTYTYYLNGVQTQTGTQSVTLISNTEPVSIGGGPSQVTLNGTVDEVRICNYAKTQQQVVSGMYSSIDANNEPNPSQTNVTFNFEGTLADYTDGAPRGAFVGTGLIRFTQVYNNATEFPTPLDRWDAGNFSTGFWNKYSDLSFGASPTTVTDSLNYSQSLTISDINVFVGITHTYANDISVSLQNPSGSTTRVLYPGAAPNVGMNMITIFDDQADSVIGGSTLAPWSPRVRPANPLAPFNGQNAQGYWKLIVTDIFPGSDNGVLVGWGLQFNNQTVVGIGPGITQTPLRYQLGQNYPNPFNPSTTIKYTVARDGNVKIAVYDILGREVQTLVDEFKKAGSYSLLVNFNNLASGAYFYTIKSGDFTDSKKMLLIK